MHLQRADACERISDVLCLADEYPNAGGVVTGRSEYAYRLQGLPEAVAVGSRADPGIDPGAARLSQALGREYLEQGRADLAEAAFEKALRRDATLADVHLSLARIYLADGRLDELRALSRVRWRSFRQQGSARCKPALRPRAARNLARTENGIDAEIGVAVRGVDCRWPAGVCSSSAAPPGPARSDVDARAGDPGNSAARRRGPQSELDRALAAQDYERAAHLLADAIERQPKSRELLLQIASVFMMDRKPLNAAIALKARCSARSTITRGCSWRWPISQ